MRRLVALLLAICGVVLEGSLSAQVPEGSSSGAFLARPPVQLPTTPPIGTNTPIQEPQQARPVPPPERRRFLGERNPSAELTPREKAFDAAEAQREAQELATLAQKIPAGISQVSKDVLPKDLIQQLKQIEKLAKRLRKEVSR